MNTLADVIARREADLAEAERLAARARETGFGIVARERNLAAARTVLDRLRTLA